MPKSRTSQKLFLALVTLIVGGSLIAPDIITAINENVGGSQGNLVVNFLIVSFVCIVLLIIGFSVTNA